MSCKIHKIKNSIEGGERSWFILNADFSSLQARLASIDCYLNPSGIDLVLFSVYKDGSKTSDLHSMTGFNTFCKSIAMKAIRVHDDTDNKDYVFVNDSNVRIMRGREEMQVKAKDLLPEDHILEHL